LANFFNGSSLQMHDVCFKLRLLLHAEMLLSYMPRYYFALLLYFTLDLIKLSWTFKLSGCKLCLCWILDFMVWIL